MMSSPVIYECDDFLGFQDALKKMRFFDDKIIYNLNTSLPTESFQGQVDPSSNCKQLFNELQINYTNRDMAIKKCISISAERLRELKQQREKESDNISLIKDLRAEQTKLRILQSELNVEEVIKERTNKVFQERCKNYYRAKFT